VTACGTSVGLLGDSSSTCDPAAPTGTTGGGTTGGGTTGGDTVLPPTNGSGDTGLDLGTATTGGAVAGPTAGLTNLAELARADSAHSASPIFGLASTGSPVRAMILLALALLVGGGLSTLLARLRA
jgi:hypothetical protein